ncbi:MAG: single-stranded DNA-binding protein [Elusimicrobiota bacterium]|jgi:single-strand DNA-binding protein|nr:single-stranded DNA-binding protein [Elusimicrobiota bacterium]
MNQQQSNLRLPEQNLVLLVGRVTHDSELRFTTAAGRPVCSFDIAMSRRYLDPTTNEWKDSDPVYVPIVVWGDMAQRCGERAKKGAPVCIEGRLQSSSWEDKETRKKRTKLEVVASRVQFLAKNVIGGQGQAPVSETIGARPAAAQNYQPPSIEGGDDEDIPF